jgi:hypothetical protein
MHSPFPAFCGRFFYASAKIGSVPLVRVAHFDGAFFGSAIIVGLNALFPSGESNG